MKVIIVGGVAGGASCAARLRRLDENAEILMLERGPYVSYANCGLPYHVGGVIEEESELLVADAELFRSTFNIDVRTRHEVTGVAAGEKSVEITDLDTGKTYTESYDSLVLSPGAPSIYLLCPVSTCRASSHCGRFRTPARYASGWNAVPTAWPAYTTIPATRQ